METRSYQYTYAKSTDKLEITRVLNLNPLDWRWAIWRQRNPLPRPEIRPFDLNEALQRLKKILGRSASDSYTGVSFYAEWDKAQISVSISREEALFWFKAMMLQWHRVSSKEKWDDLVTRMATESLSKEMSIQDIIPILLDVYYVPRELIIALFNLFPFIELLLGIHNIFFLEDESAITYVNSCLNQTNIAWYVNSRKLLTDSVFQDRERQSLAKKRHNESHSILAALVQGFQKYILPYLTDTEIIVLQEKLRPILNPNKPDWDKFYYLAANLRMHEEVKMLVESWQEVTDSKYLHLETWDYKPTKLDIIFGLENSILIETHARRNKLGLGTSDQIRAWLANTEYSALDWVCRSIIKQYPDYQHKLLKTFTEVIKAPEAAPYMLELWLSLKKPQLARQWLEDNPVHAIVGLLPVAAGKVHTPVNLKPSELTNAAVEFLLSMKRKGYESIIEAVIELESSDIADKILTEVLNTKNTQYTPFDSKTAPKWLQIRVNEFYKFKTNKQSSSWVSPADLPALVINKSCLNEEQVNTCLYALQLSTLDSPHPLLTNLKNYCNPQSLDSFTWSLFQRWLTEGAPSKEKWAMISLGLLGSDNIALKLASLIRNWPGESKHTRAALGVECLRAIGTDTALMSIHRIAQNAKYQTFKKRASECLQAIAFERKLTREQLEDRIIPDFGLDARGKRVFDFGGRQFHFVLSADLKPLVRDEKGKLSGSLPKPGAKDNAELANQAIADWKLLKKQIDQTIKIQSARLEKAMITTRGWTWQEFETLLVRHPFMTHLVQRLVWGSYDANNQLIATFRVAEDQTYADAADEEYIPEGVANISVIHPINLGAEERAAWGQALSDYEIIPPFPQINREIYTLQPQEREQKEIIRFKDISVPTATLVWTLENLEWQRGRTDQGEIQTHYKYFPKHNITAVVGEYENAFHGGDMYGEEVIDACCFVSGSYVSSIDGMWGVPKERILRLSEVDTVIFSEVLRDLHIVIAKRNK